MICYCSLITVAYKNVGHTQAVPICHEVTYTDSDLANHNSDHLEIGDRRNPVGRALGGLGAPTCRPSCLEKGLEISDGEQNIAFETKPGSRENGMSEVPDDGAQRIILEHRPDAREFLVGLGSVGLPNEGEALEEGQIRPVDALGCVGIVRLSQVSEDFLLLPGSVVTSWVVLVLLTRWRAVRHRNLPDRRLMLVVATKERCHDRLLRVVR